MGSSPRINPAAVDLGPAENAFVHQRLADTDVLRIYGEVDLASSADLEKAIRAAMRPDVRVVIDLGPCAFIDTSVLSVLMRLAKEFRGRFGLALAPTGAVRRLFEVTALLKCLPIVDPSEVAEA